jgi:hypothetical protein
MPAGEPASQTYWHCWMHVAVCPMPPRDESKRTRVL